MLRRTVTRIAGGRVGDKSAQRKALTSLLRIPAMKSSPAITASRRPRSAATWADLDAAAAPAPSVARGEHGREVGGAERAGLAHVRVRRRS